MTKEPIRESIPPDSRRMRLITIKGRTMTARDCAREPGAVKYWSILNRLNNGWPAARAVFFPVDRLRSAGALKARRSVRRSAIAAPRLAPCPRIANPHPPTWGGFASYPIEALPLLRRVA